MLSGALLAAMLLFIQGCPAEPDQPSPPKPPSVSVKREHLRVCADPNNLPFSNEREEGFENRIARLIAADLGIDVQYTWWAQRRGFLRNTLKAGLCDVVIGVPSALDMVLATAPYYRSIYVFVSRADRGLDIRSFDDPRLHALRVGVQLIGDDGNNSPPAHALARRNVIDNIVGYTVYGNYAEPNPSARIVRAVAASDVDVAVVWGPLAGYFAKTASVPLALAPVSPQVDQPFLPFAYDISMGVRRGEEPLRDELDRILVRERGAIGRILDDYGVPRAPAPVAPSPTGADLLVRDHAVNADHPGSGGGT